MPAVDLALDISKMPWLWARAQPQVSKFQRPIKLARLSHVRRLGARLLLPHVFQDFRRLAATATYQSGRVSQDQCRDGYTKIIGRVSVGCTKGYWTKTGPRINRSKPHMKGTVDPLLTHSWLCSLGGRLVVPRSSKAHLAVGHVNASPLQKPLKVAQGCWLMCLNLKS